MRGSTEVRRVWCALVGLCTEGRVFWCFHFPSGSHSLDSILAFHVALLVANPISV